jgi:hypothetical protein
LAAAHRSSWSSHYPDPEVAQAVTIRHLLTHTSGRGDWSESELSPELLLAGKVPYNDRVQYACGFLEMMVNGQRVVGHGGGAPGVCSSLHCHVEQGYTVVVLSNSDGDCLAAAEAIREVLAR